jgi:hypothetical protein
MLFLLAAVGMAVVVIVEIACKRNEAYHVFEQTQRLRLQMDLERTYDPNVTDAADMVDGAERVVRDNPQLAALCASLTPEQLMTIDRLYTGDERRWLHAVYHATHPPPPEPELPPVTEGRYRNDR